MHIRFARDSVRIILLTLLFAGGCTFQDGPVPTGTSSAGNGSPVIQEQDTNLFPTGTPQPDISEQTVKSYLALTYQRMDGNRFVDGVGGHPGEALDIRLAGSPLWLVAGPYKEGSVWSVALEDGRVQTFHLLNEEITELDENVFLPPGMPVAMYVAEDEIQHLVPPHGFSSLTHPVVLENGSQVVLDQDGDLHFISPNQNRELAVDALPDARLLVDGSRILFLSNPSKRYPHGVLGDEFEATSITLVDSVPEPHIVLQIRVADTDVIEGIAPIWTDLNQDGQLEIIVTQSNAQSGARIVVYAENGSQLASSSPIGQAFRWRHQLVVGPFGEHGTMELAVVRTPHIGGVIEFFRWVDDRLEITAVLDGFSSHQIGSRNLDSAVAGDFDGDGVIELVVPDQSQTALAGVQRSAESALVVWRYELDAKLTTNIAAVRLPDGRLAFGAGQAGNVLKIWLP